MEPGTADRAGGRGRPARREPAGPVERARRRHADAPARALGAWRRTRRSVRGADRRRPRLLRGRRRQGHGRGPRDRRHHARGAGPGLCARAWRCRAGCTRCPSRPSPWCAARPPAPGCRWRWPATCASPATARASPPPSPAIGYSGDFGGSWFLTQLVGTAKARELYYTAEIVDAPQALGARPGQPRGARRAARGGDDGARRRSSARGPRVAWRYMKRNMNAAETGTLKDVLDLEAVASRAPGDRGPPRGGARLRGEARAGVHRPDGLRPHRGRRR